MVIVGEVEMPEARFALVALLTRAWLALRSLVCTALGRQGSSTMAAKPSSTKPSKNETKSDPAVSYNDFKEYEGQRYTGMKIGRSHKWYYDRGEWREKKITPDLWQITYAVTKRRAGRAPEGSGVPVGTGYHWYLVAHQNTTKQGANHYTTSLTGLKFKIAHKRAGTEKWSATPRTQRRRMITFLQGVIADLEKQIDRAGDGVSVQEKPVAARRRSVRRPPPIRKAATRRANRASRPHRMRPPKRVRRSQHSRS
jgi:hypothetical protein